MVLEGARVTRLLLFVSAHFRVFKAVCSLPAFSQTPPATVVLVLCLEINRALATPN